MSAKCIKEILDRAKGLGLDFSEREAGEMFRKIRKLDLKYQAEQADPQGFLSDEFKTGSEKAPRGEALRQKIKSLSPEDRIREYAKVAYEDTIAEKKEALRRHYLQIQKNAAIAEKVRITDQKTHVKALNEVTFGAEARRNAIVAFDMAEMTDAIDKYHGVLGYRITREDALNVVREIGNPGSTKDARAKELAQIWTKSREAARERKNQAGADVGKLRDWIMPQAWDTRELKVAGLSTAEKAKLLNPLATKAERTALYLKAKLSWVEDAMQHIDRKRYWDENTGKQLTETELREALAYAWETITTDGLNEPVNSAVQGSLAKRLGAHREIHFKSPDSWYDMATKYGEKDIFTLMTSTIRKDAKDISMLETYGPNPNSGFRTALDMAKYLDQSDTGATRAENYFDELKGANSMPVNELAANAMRGMRQWLVAAKLGGVLLSQFNDIATYAAIARTDGLGLGRALKLAVKSLNPLNKADQKLARRHSILAQSVINDVAQRYGETVKGAKLSSRFANATVKLAGMEWWTNGMKRAYQLLIGSHLHDALIAGDKALDPHFKAMLDRYGIGPAEWDIIKQAKPVDIMGETVITPTAVKLLGDTPQIRETALKVAEMMNEEADIAIVSPGIKEMALMKSGTKPGTVSGEFMRSTFMFKTFTLSMSTKVLPRIFNKESLKTARGAETAALFALGMIIMGGVSYQLKEIVKGRNPRDISTPGFWGAATAQSGGLGIFGDFLFSDVNRFGGGWTNTLAGPVAGLGEDIAKLTIGNLRQATQGKDTKMAAESIQFAKNYAPVINLWYTRAAIDHLLFFKLQEAANPGYLRRMKKKVEAENNQTFWWNPEDTLPQSAPDMQGAVGGR